MVGVRRLASRKIRGPSASLGMTQKTALNDARKEPQSKRASSPFCDFFSPGAGVTPAQGSLKPTAGFKLNKVNCSLLIP
jgi:hypothetical protein